MPIGKPLFRADGVGYLDGGRRGHKGPTNGTIVKPGEGEVFGDGLNPVGVGVGVSRAAKQVTGAAYPSYEEAAEREGVIAVGIFDKLKSAGGVLQRPYPADLCARGDINISGKGYLGQRSMYIFEEGHASIFELNKLWSIVAGLQLSDEEMGFVVERCFSGNVRKEAVSGLLATECGVTTLLITIINSAYSGSAESDLRRYFGSQPIERGLEKIFKQPEGVSAA